MANNKILIELHPLGDILFNQKLFSKLIENKYEVYFPLPYKYAWLQNYINKPNLFWRGVDDPYIFLNLGLSQVQNHPYDVMTCKYSEIGRRFPFLEQELHNIDYSDWASYLNINRILEKENDLFYNYLNLEDNSNYIVCNCNYGMNQIQHNVGSNIQNNKLPIVWMDIMPQFTLFDWAKVLENATEIHTVDTSVLYLTEILKLKAEILNIYPRHVDHVPKTLNGLFKKDWKFIYE